MHPIRHWRVRRAYALLRMTLRLRRTIPDRAILVTAQYTVDFAAMCGRETPEPIVNAIDVITSGGVIVPTW